MSFKIKIIDNTSYQAQCTAHYRPGVFVTTRMSPNKMLHKEQEKGNSIPVCKFDEVVPNLVRCVSMFVPNEI